jgi:hypothetical protein
VQIQRSAADQPKFGPVRWPRVLPYFYKEEWVMDLTEHGLGWVWVHSLAENSRGGVCVLMFDPDEIGRETVWSRDGSLEKYLSRFKYLKS